MSDVRIVRSGDARRLPFLDGSTMSFLATGADTQDLVSFWEFELPAGGQGPPPHVHRSHDEIFFIIDGVLTVHTEAGEEDVPAGSLVLVPRGARHTFSNRSEQTMRMVGTFSPARFEQYFGELAAEIEKHGGARPDASVIDALYAKYDSAIIRS
jgi:quercetin dioxygenase-like cupin family protein